MTYTAVYNSPLGEILLSTDEIGLTGLWFKDQKYYGAGLTKEALQVQISDVPHLNAAAAWLDRYFAGEDMSGQQVVLAQTEADTEEVCRSNPMTDGCRDVCFLPLHLVGTDFQREVWEILLSIPRGETLTYAAIGKRIAEKRGLSRMSAQAVGGAVGHNKISIIVPCHRVLGTDGSLTGYAGGLERKRALLQLEGVEIR